MKERTKTLLILVVLLVCSFLPVFAASPFSQQDSSLVIKEVLMETSVAYLWLSPVVHAFTVVLLVALYFFGSRAGRVADGFFAILFLFIAFSNHIAVTDTYGLAVVTGNLVPILIVGLFWVWEVYKPQNDYVFEKLPAWRYWVLPFAFLAFWFPINTQLNPDFNPLLLLNSSFGVMYCPTTPVIIALLTLIYPRVNKYVLTTTSFVGLIMGLFNTMSYFIMPGYTLWNLVLHTPLISIALYGLLIPILVTREPPFFPQQFVFTTGQKTLLSHAPQKELLNKN
jgi:MFS family permease